MKTSNTILSKLTFIHFNIMNIGCKKIVFIIIQNYWLFYKDVPLYIGNVNIWIYQFYATARMESTRDVFEQLIFILAKFYFNAGDKDLWL